MHRRRRAKVHAYPGKHLCDLDLAHRRAKRLQPLNDMVDDIRKLVNRRRQLYESVRPVFIQSLYSRSDYRRLDDQCLGRLLERPTASRLEFQDGHSFVRRIMRPSLWWNRGRSGIFDPHFLSQPSDFLSGLAEFCIHFHLNGGREEGFYHLFKLQMTAGPRQLSMSRVGGARSWT
jgi:hypothetical protein